MLKTETITSIAVDGANRKWLGTSGSGAYLLSPDGTAQIRNFNEENSPLFQILFLQLAVDNKTGDVWFGTSKGNSVLSEVMLLREWKNLQCLHIPKSCKGRILREMLQLQD